VRAFTLLMLVTTNPNERAGLSIQKPSFEVPTEGPTASSSMVTTSSSRSSKLEELMVTSPNLLTLLYEIVIMVQQPSNVPSY
jgi:hypothetical protein